MAALHNCPDRTVLGKLARHELQKPELTNIESHLSQCQACLSQFVELGQQQILPNLDHCHVVKEIGRGRFGVVYKAWWTKGPPKLVAIKVQNFEGQVETERFEREIAALTELKSPRIVKCLDVGTTGDMRYFVMELVDGQHLDEYLEYCAPTVKDKLVVFQRICEAVADAHAKGVVHRDLKPRNILIDAQGQPHILDFGICAFESSEWGSSVRGTITRVGDLVGTLKYMSPEQAWGGANGAADERSDIWSLGIMLYEIATGGDYPYSLRSTTDKSAPEALLERIRKEMPAPPQLEDVDRPRDLAVLLERCLCWDKNHRLSSTKQLADDLARYVENRTVKTKPLAVWQRVGRLMTGLATRSRWPLLLGIVAALSALLWGSAYLFDIRWQVRGDAFGNADTLALTSPTLDPSKERVVIIGISDESTSAVLDYWQRQGLDGVSKDVKTWRAVHGQLLEKLSKAGPMVVAWDYFFRSLQPGDQAFVTGAKRLQAANIPLVIGCLNYNKEGRPNLSPQIMKPLDGWIRHGAITARSMVEREGEFLISYHRPDGPPVPSLALSTLAASLHPKQQLDIDWSHRDETFNLLYRYENGDYLRDRDQIQFNKVFALQLDQPSLSKGDIVGCMSFPLQEPGSWQRRVVPYEFAIQASADELRKLVSNKVVLIGDLRANKFGFRADRHRVRYGSRIEENVPGCFLMADAITGLLGRSYYQSMFPLPATTFMTMLLLAIVACLIPIGASTTGLLDTPRARRWTLLSLVVIATGSYACMVLSQQRAMVYLGAITVSITLPMAGSFWLECTRNRFRILDKKVRDANRLAADLSGTVTIK